MTNAVYQRFLQEALPTREQEAWRYTPLTWLKAQAFLPVPHKPTIALAEIPRLPFPSIRLVIVDGYWMPEYSDMDAWPEGLHLLDWSSWRAQNPAETELDKEYATPFSDLNAVLAGNGLVLRVDRAVCLDRPLHLVHLTSAGESAVMTHTRHRLHLEPGAQATLIEEYVGAQRCYFTNVVLQVELQSNATLQWLKLQQEDQKQAAHIANTTVLQQQDSCLHYLTVSLGGKLSRDNLNIELQAAGAQCHLRGLYLPKGEQLIDHHTRIEHRVPHGTSSQHYKGIMAQRGHGVFNGKVGVSPGAVHTVASQANHNLLLGAQAEIDTKPELEIYADDVKCAHGATVGQLDEEALFYLQTRGIPQPLAQQLLMHAFAQEVLTDFPDARLCDYVRAPLTAWLEDLSCTQ